MTARAVYHPSLVGRRTPPVFHVDETADGMEV